MKNLISILFVMLMSFNVFGQRRANRNINGIPQTRSEPTEQEIAKREREMKERKEEYIANFLTTLEADEFQKEIIKQKINSFLEAKLAIFKTRYEHTFDREQAIKKLEDTHFKELDELISKNDIKKIKEMIKGDFNEKEVEKKKKKKKRKKRKKNKD